LSATFGGVTLDRANRRIAVMAIVNVTPDSFSDGGERLQAAQAIDDGAAADLLARWIAR
jgi:dihydropteroate synthase